MPEAFTQEELVELNDLRRRIANGGEYTELELEKAISIFIEKRTQAASNSSAKTKEAKAKAVKVDLDDLLSGL